MDEVGKRIFIVGLSETPDPTGDIVSGRLGGTWADLMWCIMVPVGEVNEELWPGETSLCAGPRGAVIGILHHEQSVPGTQGLEAVPRKHQREEGLLHTARLVIRSGNRASGEQLKELMPFQCEAEKG